MKKMHDLLQNLADRGLTLGSVESMTGGLFAAEATSVPGSSGVFKGAIVSYSAEVKEKVVGVDPEIIQECGVVSEQVAREMAARGREALGVDVAIAITGNAGPTAERGKAPIGQIYLGLSTEDAVWAFGYRLEGERDEIRAKAVKLMVEFGLSQFPPLPEE